MWSRIFLVIMQSLYFVVFIIWELADKWKVLKHVLMTNNAPINVKLLGGGGGGGERPGIGGAFELS